MNKIIILVIGLVVIGGGVYLSNYLLVNEVNNVTQPTNMDNNGGMDFIVPELSKNDLISSSDVIIIGTVTKMEDKQVYYSGLGGNVDVTHSTILVERYIKKDPNIAEETTLTIETTIGINPIKFSTGQRIIAFLKKPGDIYFVNGISQGKFDILPDESIGNTYTNSHEKETFTRIFGSNRLDIAGLIKDIKDSQ